MHHSHLLFQPPADFQSDSDSFNPTLWEEQRQQRMTVAFEFEDKKEEEENPGKVKVSIAGIHFLCTGFNIAGLELKWICVLIPALSQKGIEPEFLSNYFFF